MPDQKTVQRAAQDKKDGKAPSTQAGDFVREEMEHIREGKHGAQSAKQAIAIGLSKARRARVQLPPPSKDKASEATRRKAKHDLERGERGASRATSKKRASAVKKALQRKGRVAASKTALSRQARSAARRRTAAGP